MKLFSKLRYAAGLIFGSAPGPGDDYWYQSRGIMTASGQRVSPHDSLKATAMLGGVRLISQTVAGLPLFIYQRKNDTEKSIARSHPLYSVLHDRPNRRQTAFQFRSLMQAWQETYGNAYAKIVPGPRGGVDQLLPMHPANVTPKIVDNERMFFEYRPPNARMETLLAQEVFHLSGFSMNGWIGENITQVAGESIGMALAVQDYGNRYFANNASPSVVLTYPGTLAPEAHDRLKADWVSQFSGSGRHGTAILENGLKAEEISSSNKDAQFIELRGFAIKEIARALGIPPHKIGDLDKATFSNIEQQAMEFVQDCILSRCINWEQSINNSLISEPDRFFAEHSLAGLLRGDLKSRVDAYAIGIQWGFYSPNEVRAWENLNPRDGGDEYLTPLNMAISGSDGKPIVPQSTPSNAQLVTLGPRVELLARAVSERVWRRESSAVTAVVAKKHGSEFREWTEAFYLGHGRFTAAALQLEPEAAFKYADEQSALLLDGRPEWSSTAVERLTALALRQ